MVAWNLGPTEQAAQKRSQSRLASIIRVKPGQLVYRYFTKWQSPITPSDLTWHMSRPIAWSCMTELPSKVPRAGLSNSVRKPPEDTDSIHYPSRAHEKQYRCIQTEIIQSTLRVYFDNWIVKTPSPWFACMWKERNEGRVLPVLFEKNEASRSCIWLVRVCCFVVQFVKVRLLVPISIREW